MKENVRTHQQGFTLIELLVVVVMLLILGTLIALTYSGVQEKNRNDERQKAINTLQGQLEAYYAQTNAYPTLSQINDAGWRAQHMKKVEADLLKDPTWSQDGTCSKNERATLEDTPTVNCYAYQATASEGGACDDKNPCAHYTLTATLEGGNGERYVKGSLN
jgi:general secretion pathway protein G